jgi:AmmeMemoRadiSam system protein A
VLALTEKDKEQLKGVARSAIEAVLFGQSEEAPVSNERLEEKGGAFVTIKKKGDLRGCVGYIRAVFPIHQTVKEAAVQAAFHDPRFAPLNEKEWKDIEIEISVLTPMKKIKDIEEIEVGKHGLYIEKGYESGLLLPQVAAEYDWDRMTFLQQTCYKAGLQRDAWRLKGVDIYIFSADIF